MASDLPSRVRHYRLERSMETKLIKQLILIPLSPIRTLVSLRSSIEAGMQPCGAAGRHKKPLNRKRVRAELPRVRRDPRRDRLGAG